MSNLSDNEIINLLKKVYDMSDTKIHFCIDGNVENIITINMNEIRNIINRLKAENERLKKENHRFADIGKMYSEIKSEARKEFAEKLLRKATFMRDEEKINGGVRVADIYETLEESGVSDEQTV